MASKAAKRRQVKREDRKATVRPVARRKAKAPRTQPDPAWPRGGSKPAPGMKALPGACFDVPAAD